jgi:single-stranded DNA-binding protein
MEQLHGFLVDDSQVKEAHGTTVVTFRVAVYRNFQDHNGEWKATKREFDCSWWNVKRISKYLLKGRLVIMTGLVNAEPVARKEASQATAQLTFGVASLEWYEISNRAPENPLGEEDFSVTEE